MKYLIISDCYYPARKSISRHIYDLLKKISAEEKTVDFYFPYYGNKSFLKKKYQIKNIRYFPIKMKDFKKQNFLIRGFDEFFMPFIFWNKIKNNNKKFNKILIFSPSIFFGLIINNLKKKFSCKIILIVRDVFPDWVLQKKIYLWFNPLFLFAKIISKIQYHYSDVIAAQSNQDKKILEKKYKNKEVKVIYNWISPKNLKIKKKKLSNNFVFAGTIGPAQNWKNIIELIKNLNKQNYKFNFYFVGDGKYKNFLKRNLSSYTNVFFKKSLPEDKFLNFLSKMDIGLISLHYNIKFNNIPGKFFSYLEANIPILLDVKYDQEISKIVKKYKIGFSNNSIENKLTANAELFIKKKMDYKNLKKKYEKVLKEKFSTNIAYKKIS